MAGGNTLAESKVSWSQQKPQKLNHAIETNRKNDINGVDYVNMLKTKCDLPEIGPVWAMI